MSTTRSRKKTTATPERSLRGRVGDAFHHFSAVTSRVVGSPWSFLAALLIIVIWGGSGPAFHYSDTWQLVINTSTTIVTFLMVFLIQNTQNRDAKAIHLKLDELIRAIDGARNQLVDLEEMSDEELRQLEKEFADLRQKASAVLEERPARRLRALKQ